MTFLLTMGTKQEMKTGACKDTSHPETITVFSGVSHHALKTGMSYLHTAYFRIAFVLGNSYNSLLKPFWNTAWKDYLAYIEF